MKHDLRSPSFDVLVQIGVAGRPASLVYVVSILIHEFFYFGTGEELDDAVAFSYSACPT